MSRSMTLSTSPGPPGPLPHAQAQHCSQGTCVHVHCPPVMDEDLLRDLTACLQEYKTIARHTSYRKDIMHGKALICACVWVWPDSIYTHHAFWIAEMITIAHTNSTQLHHIYTTHHAHMQSVTGWPIKTKPGRKEPVSRANNYGFCLHLPVWVLLLLSPSVEIIIWFLL